ncbi:MAG: formate--tetrahydrofolate ligase [Clostridia bacterium]|nr:formate--tetrahydrofolate ligase [Clostridia bacterium]MBR2391604.1 formate--tetrahydrofolate ligase [Clostridia bacterium]
MLTDIEIASSAELLPVNEIAAKLNIAEKDLNLYGDRVAKVKDYQKYIAGAKQKGKLVLVTAMSPTKFGIGKTTVSIGLADALNQMGKNPCLALREPSLGPVFGIKGGAAGGGYSQVLPMEEINLTFTGDFDAITSANNLLSAMIDNHIFNGNELDIDVNQILFNRCLDVNDRSLREISYIIEGKDKNGNKQAVERKDHMTITAASEVMAICCLAQDFDDLKNRLGGIMVALSTTGKPIYARDLKAEGSMAVLLRNVLSPNLVQTIEHTPAFVHLGPFANIAHGCNSIIATKLALSVSDIVVTEAGFGSDLGAEKFLDVKCRIGDLSPNVVVLVGTIRGLKFHGETAGKEMTDLELVEKGLENLYHHIEVLKNTYGANVVVTINKFLTDTEEEIELVISRLKDIGVDAVVNECFAKGGSGTLDLAKAVLENMGDKKIKFAYNLNDSVETKIEDIVKNVYGGDGIVLSDAAKKKIEFINSIGKSDLPVIIAKTQFSLTDDKNIVGRPKGFKLNVRDIELKTGSGFIVVIAGSMMLMPGLSKVPNAEKIDILSDGTIIGLS